MNQNPPNGLTNPRTGGASDQWTSSTEASSSPSHIGSSVASEAKEAADHVAHVAREQVQSKLESQKERAVGGIEEIAQALRHTSQQMRSPEKGIPQYIEKAADQLERVSSYLQEASVSEMIEDVERFARRQPTVFLGSTFAIGLLGARLLKSSSRPEASESESEEDTRVERSSTPRRTTVGALAPPRPAVSTTPVVNVPEATHVTSEAGHFATDLGRPEGGSATP